MQIQMSGHHLDLTDSIRQTVNTKLSKVASRYPGVDSLATILSLDKKHQKIEIKTQYLGGRVSVNASNHDLYAAISDAAKKLDSALESRKGTLRQFRREKV